MHRSVRHAVLALAAAAAVGSAVRAEAAGPVALVRAAVAQDTSLVARTAAADSALRGGLTSVPVGTAVPLIDAIRRDLAATGNPALRSIARDLDALSTELGASEVNGARVGAVLRRVGPKVTSAARSQRGVVRTTLQSLGRQLTAAGRQLRA
jgi:hypothetical protein